MTTTTVALVTLGCARNDVDSEELAGRLEAGGFRLVEDAAEADTVVVNTCGFVEAAKKDSVDTLLAASDYLRSILAGTKHQPHVPRDRRKLLPLAPAARATTTGIAIPGHGDHSTAP